MTGLPTSFKDIATREYQNLRDKKDQLAQANKQGEAQLRGITQQLSTLLPNFIFHESMPTDSILTINSISNQLSFHSILTELAMLYITLCNDIANLQQRIQKIQTYIKRYTTLVNAINNLPSTVRTEILYLSAETNTSSNQLFDVYQQMLFDSNLDISSMIQKITNPQFIPHIILLKALANRQIHGSQRKLLFHLISLVPDTTTSESDITNCSSVIEILATSKITLNNHTEFPAIHNKKLHEPKEINWPFTEIKNELFDSRKNITLLTPLLTTKTNDHLHLSFAFVPNETAIQTEQESEDALWIDYRTPDDYSIIVTDGASQTAFGGISAEIISQNVYRFVKNHRHMPTDDEIKYIYAISAIECQYEIESRINQLDPQSFTRRALNKKNLSGGSQSVVSLVFKRDNRITCYWVGNVRIYIDKFISLDDSVFLDDSGRFASIHPQGLHGQLQKREYEIDKPYTIHIFSDALEPFKMELHQNKWFSDATLKEAALVDDATYVYISTED
jgi:hypothetical protein